MSIESESSSSVNYTEPGNMLANRVLSWLIALKYRLIEPTLLAISRARYRSFYAMGQVDPLVTIIIATYNRGRILTERTIPSILNQTYKNFEILVVGDKCIDDTPLLIARLNDPRIRFYDLSKRGKYPSHPEARWFVQGVAPRNEGLRLARGLWLSWISDDDVLLPDYLETLLKFAQEGDFEFVSASYTAERNGKIITHRPADYTPPIGGMTTWLYRSYLNIFTWNINSWRKNWDRPCDYDLQNRMRRAGVSMGFVDKVVAHLPAVEGTNTVGFAAQIALGRENLAP